MYTVQYVWFPGQKYGYAKKARHTFASAPIRDRLCFKVEIQIILVQFGENKADFNKNSHCTLVKKVGSFPRTM